MDEKQIETDPPESQERLEIVAAARLKNQGKRVHGLETSYAFFVHRGMSGSERRIYRGLQADGKVFDSQDSLLSCVLYPDKIALKDVLDDYPFAIEVLENAILAASGIDLQAKRKKY